MERYLVPNLFYLGKKMSVATSVLKRIKEEKLTTATRDNLDSREFALPGRRYPIHNISHARNALARVAQHGSPAEKAKVRRAVARRYPSIDSGSGD
jgi:hypothetical protein